MYFGPVESTARPLKRDTTASFPIPDSSPQRSQTLLWQSLSPDLRSEVLRRAQLVQLLQQVNPKLKLCREDSQPQPATQKVTVDKGTQVPDVRYRPKRAPNPPPPPPPRPIKPNPPSNTTTYTGPGIRIYNAINQENTRYGREGLNNNRTFSAASTTVSNRGSHTRSSSAPRSTTYQRNTYFNLAAGNKGTRPRRNAYTSTNNGSMASRQSEVGDNRNEPRKNLQREVKSDVDEKSSSLNEKAFTNKTQSSDEEDSVTVVVEIKSEQELERKYGQFYCRRCRRGWSSRNVWCVKLTSKVYIKQTCNGCNKVVNPFAVASQSSVKK